MFVLGTKDVECYFKNLSLPATLKWKTKLQSTMRQTILRNIINRNFAKQKEQYTYLQRQNFELQQRIKKLEKQLTVKRNSQQHICTADCFYHTRNASSGTY